MIIRRRDSELLLFQQVDHGTLTGEFVDLWGNDQFAPVTPLAEMRIAATYHDEGWRERDNEMPFNEEEGRPASFAEIEVDDHIPLYRNGVEDVLKRDQYSGLIVSMHWTGLYRSRWGLQPMPIKWGAERTPIEQKQHNAIVLEERRWEELKDSLVPQGAFRSDFEINAWHNFDLMQAFDLLSIFVCMTDVRTVPADPEPELLGLALRSLDQAPGARLIPNVPTRAGGERVDLVLRAIEPNVVTVDPYPFNVDEFELRVEATAIPDKRYTDAAEVRAAVEAGRQVTVTCKVVRP
jgi:hypothetical protein